MKLEIKERGSKEFYSECLSVMQNYRILRSNPQKKIKKLNFDILKMCIYTFGVALMYVLLYLFSDFEIKNYIIILLVSIIILILIIYFINSIKIKKMQSYKGKVIIEINENGILFKSEENNYELVWDDVLYIVINKYSICILPKEASKVLICINIEYKDKVLKAIKKYKKENLIINNSNLYK